MVETLARRPLWDPDLSTAAATLEARRIMVTGAAGSIGRAVCERLQTFPSVQVIAVDRAADLDSVVAAVRHRVDLADTEAVRALMRETAPQVLVHAAAEKHLEVCEQHPDRAWRDNVVAVDRVAAAFAEAASGPALLVSTDKAVSPVSTLGRSKRLAERVWSCRLAATSHGVVRFGNVIGSSGSVLTRWRAQLAAGGPLLLSDPAATRYLMTATESASLLIACLPLCQRGERFVLDMGEPVALEALRVAWLRALGLEPAETAVERCGLKPGERVHERLTERGLEASGAAGIRVEAGRDPELDTAALTDLLARGAASPARVLDEALEERVRAGEAYSEPVS